MEKLSIKSGKKAFLAVALVIFMLVAFLGLTVLATSSTFAAAENEKLTWTAEFTTATYEAAQANSNGTALYYNTVSNALTVDTSTFVVVYTPAISSGTFTGAILDLKNAGFQVTGITVGETVLTGTTTQTVSGLNFTPTSGFQIGSEEDENVEANLVIDGSAASIPTIIVTYKLTSAIDVFSNKTISLTSYAVVADAFETITSNVLTIYVRSQTAMTATGVDKTYDAQAATASYNYTQTVSASGAAVLPSVTETWSDVDHINAGTYSYTASAAWNNYFEAASATDSDVVISKKAITITADNKTSVYSTSPVALSYSYDSIDFYDRDFITVSYSGAGASISTATTVGSYTITPSAAGTGIGNYTVTPVNGTYTVTRHNVAVPTVTIYNNGTTTDTTIAAGTTEEKTFNGKAYTFNYTAASADANSIVPFTAAGGDAITNVGSSTLTLSVNANYYWGAEGVAVGSQDTDAKTFTIQVNKANITVTLHHDAIEYLDAVPTTGYYITAAEYLFGEDVSTVTINQADFGTAYTVGNGVGTYAITLGNDNGSKTAIEAYLSNYNVSYTGVDQLTVGAKHIDVAANWIDWATDDSASMTYDAAAHGIVAVPANYTYASAVICDVAFSGGDSAEGAKQTHVNGNEAATTLTATFTVKSTGNDGNGNAISTHYVLDTTSTSKDITITRKAVTITADDQSTIYGSAAPAFTSDAGSVLISGDDYTTTGSMTTAYTATAGNANRVAGTYDIVPAGWANNDYAISYTNGTLTVNKKVVTFTWSETKTWVYDADSHTISATVVGAEYGETITAAAYTGDANATDVGNYSRTVSSLSDNANYAITTAGTQTESYSITKQPITITITPATSLVYTSADKTVFTVTVSGMIGEETLTYTFDGTNINEADGTFTLSNASETFTGMLAQNYGLSLTAVANGTGKIGNYEYTLPSAAANTIAKATFTPGAISYSGNVVSWEAVTGVQGSDVITFTYTVKAQSGSALSYTATAAGDDYVLAISFAGDRAANYNAIADQALLEVFSVALTDDLANHPNESPAKDTITLYAFDGQTVPEQTAWTLNGYNFGGWFVNLADAATQINFSAAVTESKTYIAKWTPKTFLVTYKYRLAGTDGWTTYLEDQEVVFYTALATVPSKTWFSNIGWKDNNSLTGAACDTLTYSENRTYYTEYNFSVAIGDVNGDGSINASDSTLYRQYLAGGYTVRNTSADNGVATIAAAWTNSEAGTTSGKFLKMAADVNGDGRIFANDITTINAGIATSDTNFAVTATSSDSGKTFTGIVGTVDSVIVAGDKAAYTISDGTLTLNTALTSGQTVTIVTKRNATALAPAGITASDEVAIKYTYTK